MLIWSEEIGKALAIARQRIAFTIDETAASGANLQLLDSGDGRHCLITEGHQCEAASQMVQQPGRLSPSFQRSIERHPARCQRRIFGMALGP